jgi:glyoxylase-like metal-dependent hydrolase (beta-lactamase superfamily II)
MSSSFRKGLQELGNGTYAFLQPDGSWGWSNAGLIASDGASMLVDTLLTLELTDEMITTMRRSIPAARSFDTLVNSHADADHTWGNQLIEGAQIIATRSTAEDMPKHRPEDLIKLSDDPELGVRARFVQQMLAPFDLSGVELVMPTRTFEGKLTMRVGEKTVDLHELGPAHTRGDLIVHVPEERVVYVADLLFVGGHPAVWSGPLKNWVDACNRIIDLDAEIVVPGHGPVADNDDVRRLRDYLLFVGAEGRRFHAEGLSHWEAALAIDLSDYEGWNCEERIVLALDTVYRELNGEEGPRDPLEIWEDIGRYVELKGGLR